MKQIVHFFQKIFVWLYHFSYHKISALAILENGGIHPKHQITKYHEFFVNNIERKDKVLDIGCGDGINTLYIAKKAKSVTSIDIIKKRVEFAKKHHTAANIKYLFGDATRYDFSDYFDKVVLSNVLEHIKDRKRFLKSLGNLASVLLIRVPLLSREWLPVYLKSAGYDYAIDPTHETEFTVNSFQKEIEDAGWKIAKESIQFGEIWAVVIKK